MMATPAWAPGTLYAPGTLVVPRTAPATTWPALNNGNFESGDFTDWDTITSDPYLMLTVSNFRPFAGVYGSFYRGINGGSGIGGGSQVVYLHQTRGTVRPGQSVTLSAYIAQDDTSNSQNYGAVRIYWFKADDSPCSPPYSEAAKWVAGNYNNYEFNSVTAQAPAAAAYARAGVWQNANNQGGIRADNVTWTSVLPPVTAGLLYRAVQPSIGTSDNVEPVWPPTVGVTVVDNTVTWEAVLMSRVVWEARPILRSGATEPDWPLTVGTAVSDNTISWITATRQVEQAPNSKVVAITASKVFAADEDIIRYSATVNPLDWTSTDNAGYLPSGLNQNGSNDTAVLNIYRGNLVGFSSSTFQNWQVDEDPANMELLDVMEGIGSTWQHAAQPVAKDLFYLAALGVRTVGIAGGSVNLVNGDAGMPIDPLVRAAIRVADANTIKPIGMYYPSLGQYMLAFGDYPPGELSISGDLELAAVNQPLPAFSYTASGGVRPYAFSLRGGTSMPPGLTLNEDGSVTGTPTETGSFSWEVQVVDALGNIAWKPDDAEIVLGPSISGEAPNPVLGEPYSFTYPTVAGTFPIDRTEILTPLPDGWAWDESSATIYHSSNVDGFTSINVLMRVYDENNLFDDHEDLIYVDPPSIQCGVANNYSGGEAFPTTFYVQLGPQSGEVVVDWSFGVPDKCEVWVGGVLRFTTGYSGQPIHQSALNVTLDSIGVPRESIIPEPPNSGSFYKSAGEYLAEVRVYGPINGTLWGVTVGCPDSDAPAAILTISGSCPDPLVGYSTPFSYATYGGTEPYEFRVSSGNLPTGRSIDPETGVVTGEYEALGTYSYTVEVEDAVGAIATVSDTVQVKSNY